MKVERLSASLLAVGGAALFASFLAAWPAVAQTKPTQSDTTPTQLQTPAELNRRLQQAREALAESEPRSQGAETRIGPEDLLNISVFEAPEMNATVRVSAGGEIALPLLGAVRASGLTPGQLEAALQARLRGTYLNDPHVAVFIQELQSHPISVVGAVKMPGVFQIRGSKSVLEMISMAQGLSDDAGETVTVMRGPGHVVPESKAAASEAVANKIVEINLKRLMGSDDTSANISVHPGDVIKVSRAGIVYVVGGGVKTPGGFVLKNNENISVLQALALAQGLTRTSSKDHAVIIRTNQETNQRIEIPVNLGKILTSKAADPILQPRDIVYVPDSAAKSVMYRGAEAALSTATGVAIYRW